MKKLNPQPEINFKKKFIAVAIIFFGGLILIYFASYFAHFVAALF